MLVYCIMIDMQQDGYELCAITSAFDLAKDRVEANGPSLHGDIDIVEYGVDGAEDEATVFTLYKKGTAKKTSWTHPKFKSR